MSRINYDLSKIRAVVFDIDGVLSPSTIPMDADGLPMRMANLKDGYALQYAVKCGLKMAIISGAETRAVENRFRKIGFTDIFQGQINKLPVFNKWLDDNELKPEEVAYVGDDIPDIPVMRACGLSIAPADAAIDVKQIATHITTAAGGYGVAREIIEEILRFHGLWMQNKDAFGW